MSASSSRKPQRSLQKPAFGSFTTLMPDGSPQTTPVWVDFENGKVIVNTALGRQKDKNVRRDPRVAITLIDPENPYRYLEMRGQVHEITARGRRETHRQDGEEIPRQGQISVGHVRGTASADQSHARRFQLDGLGLLLGIGALSSTSSGCAMPASIVARIYLPAALPACSRLRARSHTDNAGIPTCSNIRGRAGNGR